MAYLLPKCKMPTTKVPTKCLIARKHELIKSGLAFCQKNFQHRRNYEPAKIGSKGCYLGNSTFWIKVKSICV